MKGMRKTMPGPRVPTTRPRRKSTIRWYSRMMRIGQIAIIPASISVVALFVSEAEVAELLSPAEAVDVIEACFQRMAEGVVENRPRYRLGLDGGALAVMAAADLGLGYAGAK